MGKADKGDMFQWKTNFIVALYECFEFLGRPLSYCNMT